MDKKENSTGKLKSSKRKIRVILGIVIIIIVILIAVIIHLVSPKVISEITADGMLGYIISALSAIVTGILAIYAITQTDKANEMTKQANEIAMKANDIADKSIEMTKQANEIAMKANDIAERVCIIEENDYEIKYSPFFFVSSCELCNLCDSCEKANFKFEVENIVYKKVGGIILSITNATDLMILLSCIEYKSKKINWNRKLCKKIILNPSETKTICFKMSEESLNALIKKQIRLTFHIENRFAQRYKESFDILIVDDTNFSINNLGLSRIENDGNEREIKIG